MSPREMPVEGCEAQAGDVRQILDPGGFGIVVPRFVVETP
jgi:hypothetical protein